MLTHLHVRQQQVRRAIGVPDAKLLPGAWIMWTTAAVLEAAGVFLRAVTSSPPKMPLLTLASLHSMVTITLHTTLDVQLQA